MTRPTCSVRWLACPAPPCFFVSAPTMDIFLLVFGLQVIRVGIPQPVNTVPLSIGPVVQPTILCLFYSIETFILSWFVTIG